MTRNINTERRYALRVYHRAADKQTCPNCGKKHRFSEFIDLRTGMPVGPGCGKCDRINSCGYKLTPSEYYRLHPEAKYNHYIPYATPAILPQPKPRVYLPEDAMQRYSTPYTESNFGYWLTTVAPSKEALQNTVEMYHLTSTRTRGIIYWYIDHTGRPCQGKIMWYNRDGHRNGYVYSVSKDMAKQGLMPDDAEMKRTLFGAHLLRQRPDDKVYIVESEKSAILMSMYQPNGIWLATGGCSMLNEYVLRPLKDRHVTVIPDSGMYDKWYKTMKDSGHRNFYMVDSLEQYEPNTDIADVVLDNKCNF